MANFNLAPLYSRCIINLGNFDANLYISTFTIPSVDISKNKNVILFTEIHIVRILIENNTRWQDYSKVRMLKFRNVLLSSRACVSSLLPTQYLLTIHPSVFTFYFLSVFRLFSVLNSRLDCDDVLFLLRWMYTDVYLVVEKGVMMRFLLESEVRLSQKDLLSVMI